MTQLIYVQRPKRPTPSNGPWWLEVAIVPDRNADPLTGGRVLAMFELTVDALDYAIGLATISKNAIQVIYEDAGEVGAIMATVAGSTVYITPMKGRLEIELGRTGIHAAAYVVVRPCHAPGEPA